MLFSLLVLCWLRVGVMLVVRFRCVSLVSVGVSVDAVCGHTIGADCVVCGWYVDDVGDVVVMCVGVNTVDIAVCVVYNVYDGDVVVGGGNVYGSDGVAG